MADLAAYRSWAASVKQAGGVVTVFPSGPSKGQPAARFTKAQVATLQAAKRLGAPGVWSANGGYGYYLATPTVVAAARLLPVPTQDEIDRGAAQLTRSWLGDIGAGVLGDVRKYLVIGGVVLLAVKLGPLAYEMLQARRRARG